MSKRFINKNFLATKKAHDNNKYVGIFLEGSSRSGKTIAVVDFFIYLFTREVTGKTLNIVRQTYNGFKSTLYDDWDKRLKAFGLESPFDYAKEVRSFKINGNKVNFLGCDNPNKFEGASADYWYFNEILDIEKRFFDLGEQRCRAFWIADANPKLSQQWVFNSIINRDDVMYCHSTYKDNPYISRIERNKLLSYEPTVDNIRQGTADDYMHDVYSLGKRRSPSGVVFKHINWITEFPANLENIMYGIDFGFTVDPCAIVKYTETERDIYVQELFYAPLENALLIDEILTKLNVDKKALIICDSASPDIIKELFAYGWRTMGVKKPKGSIEFGIGKLKEKRLNIVY